MTWMAHLKRVFAIDIETRIGRPGRLKGETIWDVKDHQVSSNAKGSGTSISASVGDKFAKALEQLASKRQSNF